MNHYIRFFVYLIIPILLSYSPGIAGTKRNRPISDTLDALHYAIHLNVIDPSSQQIDGFTILTLTPKHDQINHICLELLELEIDSVFIDDEQTTDFTHYDPLLEIPLTAPISIGDTLIIRVHYHGEPFHEGWGGFHFSGNFAFNLGIGFESNPHNLGKAWFPCIDDFRDRASYDCYIRVNDAQTAVCSGTLLGIEDHPDNTRTFHWQLLQPVPAYMASVAVGNYFLIEDTFAGIQGDIPVTFYVRSVDTAKVAGSFIHLHDILHTFEERFGPYSWPRIGYVSTALGAMEHATNVAFPYGCINGGLTYESLYAHEVSHMWFGDKVTCASAEDMWLNEGWAVFCEAIFREGIYGKASYMENINDLHAEVLQFCHTPLGDDQYFALYGIPPEYTYGSTVYDKGGLVAHTLRGYLGDSLFFDAVKGFLEAFAFQSMSSTDLRDYLSSLTGLDMTGFFDAWVFTPGFPHFAVDSFQVTNNGNLFGVTVFVRQKYKSAQSLANNNRIEVTFMDENRNAVSSLMTFSGKTGVQTFQLPFEPEVVMMDLSDKICDATTDVEQTIGQSGTYDFPDTFITMEAEEVPDSAFVRVTHHWVAPDSLKIPVPGLRLSDYRYWSIDGIFPEGFRATGKFYYSKNNYLDNTLLTNQQDSLVILYRPDPASEWQSVEFTRVGIWLVGNLLVEDLQKGEYVLGVWDQSVGRGEWMPSDSDQLRVYPNPSGSSFTIQYELTDPGRILIYDGQGKFYQAYDAYPERNQIICPTGQLPNGLYLIQLQSGKQEVIACEKFVLWN